MQHAPPNVRTAYGLDLSGTSLVIARSTRSGRGTRTEILFQGPSETDAAALAARIGEECAAGKAVAVGHIPAAAGFTRWLKTPFASRKKALRVFASLLDVQIPFPVEDCRYDFLEVHQTEGAQVEALAVAARKEDVARQLDQLQDQGLDPELLDHEGLALWQYSTRELALESGALRVVAHIGHESSALVVGTHERFLASHGIRIGLRDLCDKTNPAARLRFSQRAQQVLRANLPEAGHAAFHWTWCGPGAENTDDIATLESALHQEGAIFSTHTEPATFLARALSVRPLPATSLFCNLRSGEFTHPLALRRHSRQQGVTSCAALLVGLAICAANLAWQPLLTAKKTFLQEQITTLTADLAGMPEASAKAAYGQEVRVVENALARHAATRSAFLEAFQPSLTLLVSKVATAASTHSLSLESLTLRRDRISLRGTTDDWNRCDPFEKELEALGFDVTFDLLDAGADELVHFTAQGGRHP